MNNIQILDCTLRDGGYINDFRFGKNGIKKIISQLTIAGIDIVECGFLEDGEYDEDCSVYNKVEQIAVLLPKDHRNTMYVAMACYGEYDIKQLSDYDGKSIDGIRVTFHYNEVDEALDYCKAIIEKGYKVFVQPVGTSSYSDDQLLNLIKHVNVLQPYAFYLVDTLGLMLKNDVLRFYYLINHNLNATIHFGFHSHNNLQLSYSNSQVISELSSKRIISLDASVNGMGRGAGNLNTELIAHYLNSKERRYEVEPILEVVDEFISKIREEHTWGYDVPHYLAAINGCHPNYAAFFIGKQTLTVKNIGTILRTIEPEKRSLFNKQVAESKYREFQNREIDDSETISVLTKRISGRNVIIIGPGETLNDYRSQIMTTLKDEDCITISVSFVPDFIECDYVFLSNKKRYNTTFNPLHKNINLLYTSNITVQDKNSVVLNYSSLLSEDDVIMDNSTIMLLNLLCRVKAKKVYLAGCDGYSVNGKRNYYQDRLQLKQDREQIIALNNAMTKRIKDLQSLLEIEFLTPSIYNDETSVGGDFNTSNYK